MHSAFIFYFFFFIEKPSGHTSSLSTNIRTRLRQHQHIILQKISSHKKMKVVYVSLFTRCCLVRGWVTRNSEKCTQSCSTYFHHTFVTWNFIIAFSRGILDESHVDRPDSGLALAVTQQKIKIKDETKQKVSIFIFFFFAQKKLIGEEIWHEATLISYFSSISSLIWSTIREWHDMKRLKWWRENNWKPMKPHNILS